MEGANEKLPISRIICPENGNANFGCQSCNFLVTDTLTKCKGINCNYQLCENCYIKEWARLERCAKCECSSGFGFYEIKGAELANIEVECKYPENGCKELPNYPSYILHEFICVYRPTSCKSCNKGDILFKEKDSHNKTCKFVKVLCNECNERIERGKFEEHLKEKCINLHYYSCLSCPRRIHTYERGFHKETCPLPLLTCKKCKSVLSIGHECLIEISNVVFAKMGLILKLMREQKQELKTILNSTDSFTRIIGEQLQIMLNEEKGCFKDMKMLIQNDTLEIMNQEKKIQSQIQISIESLRSQGEEARAILNNISAMERERNQIFENEFQQLRNTLASHGNMMMNTGEEESKQRKILEDEVKKNNLIINGQNKDLTQQLDSLKSTIKNEEEILASHEDMSKLEKMVQGRLDDIKASFDERIQNIHKEFKNVNLTAETVLKEIGSQAERDKKESQTNEQILKKMETRLLEEMKKIDEKFKEANAKIDSKRLLDEKSSQIMEQTKTILNDAKNERDAALDIQKTNIVQLIKESQVYNEAVTKLGNDLNSKNQDIKDLEEKKVKLQKEIKSLEFQIKYSQKKAETSETKLKEFMDKNNELNYSIQTLLNNKSLLEENLKSEKSKLSELEEKFKTQSKEIIELQKTYESNKTQLLEDKNKEIKELTNFIYAEKSKFEKLNNEQGEKEKEYELRLEEVIKKKNSEIDQIQIIISSQVKQLINLCPKNEAAAIEILNKQNCIEALKKFVDLIPPIQESLECLCCKSKGNYEHIINCIRSKYKKVENADCKFVELWDLFNQSLQKADIKQLIEVASISKTLQCINFSLNENFDDECAECYINAIRKNDSLIGIILYKTKISRKMKIEILNMYKEKKNLKFYIIDRNEFKEKEVAELAKEVKMKLNESN